jgi:hypothetical protein
VIVINPVAVASVLVYVIAASVVLYFIYLFVFAGLSRKERARLLVCFILLVSAAFFWSAFEQKPTSFNLFANDYTNRMIGSFEIPAVWFQSINALFIILLAPVFSWAWPAWRVKTSVRAASPSSLSAFSAPAGFGLMMLAAQNVLNNGGPAYRRWLVGSILMLTLGELCLSPIGLATMTLLAPERMRGQMMGLWFCASALGNLAAGLIGGHESRSAGYAADLFARCSIALLICAAAALSFRCGSGKPAEQNRTKPATHAWRVRRHLARKAPLFAGTHMRPSTSCWRFNFPEKHIINDQRGLRVNRAMANAKRKGDKTVAGRAVGDDPLRVLTVNNPAIDQDRLTGNIVGIRAGQIRDQARHIVRRFRTAERNPFNIFFIGLTDRRTGNFGKALIDFGPHAGPHNPRTVGVHGDPAAGVLFRRRLGQGANGKFSGGIDPQQRKTVVTGNGAGVDDFAVLLTVDEFFAAA